MGINKSAASATEAERTMARLNVIMEVMGSQGAMGAAARESQSFANRMKDLKAEVTDLAIAIGAELMPMALDTVKWLKDLTAGAKDAGTGVGGIADAFLTVADVLHTVGVGFQYLQARITSAISTAINAFHTLNKAILGENNGTQAYADEFKAAALRETKEADAALKSQIPSERFANRAVAETDKEINREVTKIGLDNSGIDIEGMLIDAATSFGKEVVDYGELFGLKTSNFMHGFLMDAVNLYNVKDKEDRFAKQTAGSAVRFGSAESELSRRSRLETATEKNTAKIAINTEAQKRLGERTATAAEGILKSFGSLISIPH
jgi:hypothetical protein